MPRSKDQVVEAEVLLTAILTEAHNATHTHTKKKKKSRRKQFKAPPHSLKLLRLYGDNNNKTTATKHFTAHNYGSGERFSVIQHSR